MENEKIEISGTSYTLLPGGQEMISSARRYFWFHLVLLTALLLIICVVAAITAINFGGALTIILLYLAIYAFLMVRNYETYQDEKKRAVKARGRKTPPPKQKTKAPAVRASLASQNDTTTRVMEDSGSLASGTDEQKKKP